MSDMSRKLCNIMDKNQALELKYWQLFWKTEVLMITQLSVELNTLN